VLILQILSLNLEQMAVAINVFQDQKRARSALELCSMADLGGSLGGPAGGHQSRSERSSRVRNAARVKRRASSPSNIVQVREDQCCGSGTFWFQSGSRFVPLR
jgi:hypothetical protein